MRCKLIKEYAELLKNDEDLLKIEFGKQEQLWFIVNLILNSTVEEIKHDIELYKISRQLNK